MKAKRLITIILCLLCVVVLLGCVSRVVGKTSSDLIASKGYPMEQRDVGNGVEIWVYPSLPGYQHHYYIQNGTIIKYDVWYQGGL